MSAEELRPCPFCGKDETILKEENGAQYISCCYCGSGVYGPPTGEKEDAIEFWNDRPLEQELLEALESLLADTCTSGYYSQADSESVINARAAIAKAKGGHP